MVIILAMEHHGQHCRHRNSSLIITTNIITIPTVFTIMISTTTTSHSYLRRNQQHQYRHLPHRNLRTRYQDVQYHEGTIIDHAGTPPSESS